MKSKLLLLFLSLSAFVGGVKAEEPTWEWSGETLTSGSSYYMYNMGHNVFLSYTTTTDRRGRVTVNVATNSTPTMLWSYDGSDLKNGNYYISCYCSAIGSAYAQIETSKHTPTYEVVNTDQYRIKGTGKGLISGNEYTCYFNLNTTTELTGARNDGDQNHWKMVSEAQKTAYDNFNTNLATANRLLGNSSTLSADEKAVITSAKNRLGTTVKWTDDALADFNTVIEVAKAGHPLVVKRTTINNRYGTLCLPYDFTVSGAEILQVDAVSNSIIDAQSPASDNVCKAGVPYLYKGTATSNAQTFTMKVEGAAYAAAPESDKYLVGTYTSFNVPQSNYLLQTQNGHQAFYIVQSDNVYCGQYKCYMKAGMDNSSRNEVKGLFFSEEDMTTAIDAIENSANADAQVFDLSGRKLDRLQKGVNIVGGKKIIVK